MATYAIGDLQGCYKTLQALLVKIRFNPATDKLWFVGDLVNRGADSLSCLRFIKGLGNAAVAVLGNHDLHLLAVATGIAKKKQADTLNAILEAPDCKQLLDWLRHLPLLHSQKVGATAYVMVHAGVWPAWTLSEAQGYAREVETALSGPAASQYLAGMYGAEPRTWHTNLTGNDRLRFITNTLTRMRALGVEAGELTLDTKFKGELKQMPTTLKPWFTVANKRDSNVIVLAGHWSALGLHQTSSFIGLDSGCLWGRELTAYRLEDGVVFQQANCEESAVSGED